ncbi:Protein_disulfide isomerase PDI3 [Hexamita inflata]|uniref:Protein_disulfide isomerase PDI3 n=1 Tax=Hexamita inflata TaxID=28002 RepID=A0ABP1GX11_9EUKA
MIALIVSFNQVLDVTNNLGQEIKKNKYILVNYCDTKNKFCNILKPKYDELAVQMESSQFVIAFIDCSLNKDACKNNEVNNYPTLNLYISGKLVEEYNFGPKEVVDIKKWLKAWDGKEL